ncbi:MAG: bifunctional oligoribonuclease/PAP phosphatase NrnA [Candidatus Omnitrophota bacterium]
MHRAILRTIKAHRTFLVTMHVNPDPDALGSALAMTLFLRSLGKKVRLVNDGSCPEWLKFVPQVRLYEAYTEKMKFVPEVAVVLDCGDKERIGKPARLVGQGVKVINIDHHVTNTSFGDHNLVKLDSSSTSEIVYGLLKASGNPLTRDMAELLYLGILTDTGSFGFDCTSAQTHKVIAELMKFDLSVSGLYRQAYETMPEKDLKAFLRLMNTLTLHLGNRVACLSISRRQASVFSDGLDVKDKVFGFLRAVKGLDVVMIITEQEKRKTRLNFRSRGAVDVARLSAGFNGGGHKNASGGFLDKPLAQAKTIVLAAIEKII